jgi:hypothetical protein
MNNVKKKLMSFLPNDKIFETAYLSHKTNSLIANLLNH